MNETNEATRGSDAPEAPPPGVRGMAIFRWLLIVAAALAAAGSWWSYAHADEQGDSAPRYYCPMHPSVTSHDPGECPICHMTLEPIPASRRAQPSVSSASKPHAAPPAAAPSAGAEPSSAAEPSASAPTYTCPMHPQVRSDKPGRCPICGMELVPRPATRAATTPAAAGLPKGTTEVTLALGRVQSIGVRTALAEAESDGRALRAPAVVEAPESGVAVVHARAPGFVERILVKETGVKVSAGQPLAAFYSPEIYQAELELLTVRGWGAASKGSGTEDNVRTKLRLFGVSDRSIDQVAEQGKPERTLPLVAPIGGYVNKKNVVLGSYVTPDVPLFEIVDLSRVYVIASLYDTERELVAVGTEARFQPADDPDRLYVAKVDLIYPVVNESARTTRVRLQVKTPDTSLLPGGYGSVEFAAAGGAAVTVPRDAVIDTGREVYVFVVAGEGHYVPRLVDLGPEAANDRVVVRRGLAAKERVVSGATFLIDSESRLRAALVPSEGDR
jgi:Cu(I)/Ag(I) efflux system membrane fusion protein